MGTCLHYPTSIPIYTSARGLSTTEKKPIHNTYALTRQLLRAAADCHVENETMNVSLGTDPSRSPATSNMKSRITAIINYM